MLLEREGASSTIRTDLQNAINSRQLPVLNAALEQAMQLGLVGSEVTQAGELQLTLERAEEVKSAIMLAAKTLAAKKHLAAGISKKEVRALACGGAAFCPCASCLRRYAVGLTLLAFACTVVRD